MSDRELVARAIAPDAFVASDIPSVRIFRGDERRIALEDADRVLAALSAAGRLRAEVTGEVVEAGKLAAEAVNAELCRRLEAGTAPGDTHKLTACMIAIAAPIIAADAERRVREECITTLVNMLLKPTGPLFDREISQINRCIEALKEPPT